MSSFPEVVVPEQIPDEEEPMYEKKPKVDTKRIFKSKKSTKHEDDLEQMRVKKKPVYDNPMEGPGVEMKSSRTRTRSSRTRTRSKSC